MNVRKILAIGCIALTVIVTAAFWLRSSYTVPVIMYHNIAPAKNEQERANSVSPDSFRRHMQFLRENGYRVLSMSEFIANTIEGRDMCCKSVVLTFDDGLDNNHTQALPVLKEHGYPATFFVGIFDIGHPGQMSWDQIIDASRNGIEIGSHLMNEAYVPSLDAAGIRYEAGESKRIIEEKTAKAVRYLAYPIGGFTSESKELIRQLGYEAAFTTNRGTNKRKDDLFEMRRIRVKDDDSDAELWLKLSGFYNSIRKPKKPF